MNGIAGVCLGGGNDRRAIEAGAHAYAARSGRYSPITSWHKDENGDLNGFIEFPEALGIVGGVPGVHPLAKVCLKNLRGKTARGLVDGMEAVGPVWERGALGAVSAERIGTRT